MEGKISVYLELTQLIFPFIVDYSPFEVVRSMNFCTRSVIIAELAPELWYSLELFLCLTTSMENIASIANTDTTIKTIPSGR